MAESIMTSLRNYFPPIWFRRLNTNETRIQIARCVSLGQDCGYTRRVDAVDPLEGFISSVLEIRMRA